MKKLIAILSMFATMVLCLVGCGSITLNEEQISDSIINQTSATILEEATKEIEEIDTFEYGKLVADTQYQKSQKGVERVMLVKMISETEIEELNPDYIIIDGVVYTNPKNNPNIDLKALGYKNFFIDDVPTYDGETQKVERYYYVNGDTIHRGWKIYNLTKKEMEQREQMRKMMGE